MPISDNSAEEKMPGVWKAAILMVSLGDEASSALLRELEEEEIQLISQHIARVKSVTKVETQGVLDEFYQMAVARNYVVRGGVDYARKVLMTALGPDQAKR